MIKYVKNHLAIKVFLLTMFILMALGGLVYSLILFSIPKSYLSELADSAHHQIVQAIPNLEKMTLEEGQVFLNRFSRETGLSLYLTDYLGNEIDSFGDTGYYAVGNGNGSSNTIIFQTYSLEFIDGASCQLKAVGTREQVNLPVIALKKILPWILAAVVVAAIAVSWLYARYITHPVLETAELSKKMSALDFSKRCKTGRSDELGILAGNLNVLSERLNKALCELQAANEALQEDIDRERQLEKQQLDFFSAVSHELKTPVTILKGQLEGMLYNIGGYKDREKYLKRSCQVVGVMEKLVGEILGVTRLKAADFMPERSHFELGDMIFNIQSEYEDMAIDKDIKVCLQLEENVTAFADIALFKKVVSNLIVNGIAYTPESGQIWIGCGKDREVPFFFVENESEPIPEEEIPRLFDPFYRREKSRSRATGGSGLGLYIVRTILILHEFPFELKNTNRGICVRVWCPSLDMSETTHKKHIKAAKNI